MKQLIDSLQRGKVLDQWNFLKDYKLISLDGTEFFSSKTVHCESCCQKQHKDGSIRYHHQMVVGSIVNPYEKQVFPIGFEPVTKEDGADKNDCEHNATKRWLIQYRKDHPQLETVIVADGLFSDEPFISSLKEHRCHFIIVAKEGDHKYLYEWFFEATAPDIETLEYRDKEGHHRYRWMKDVPLNEMHHDRCKVNVLYYQNEYKGKNRQWLWVTDLKITQDNVFELMKGGRARWKIENETFNTLKNQGFNFEHNYGHGTKTLSNFLAGLMLLAFMVDQISFALNKAFQACYMTLKRIYRLWKDIFNQIYNFTVLSWDDLYQSLCPDIDPLTG